MRSTIPGERLRSPDCRYCLLSQAVAGSRPFGLSCVEHLDTYSVEGFPERSIFHPTPYRCALPSFVGCNDPTHNVCCGFPVSHRYARWNKVALLRGTTRPVEEGVIVAS
jgi:hypothetical protein